MYFVSQGEIMSKNTEVLSLLKEKQLLASQLNALIYGAIEVREATNKKYIYVHYRDTGVNLTKYIGEYNDDLYNVILNNNIMVKDLKKQIRKIEKELKILNYCELELTPKVELNIDFAKRHLIDIIYKQAILEGIATTYADTENIVEGGKVNNMTPEDILKIVNLKHAWEFILNKNVISTPSNISLLCEINKLIEEGFYYHAGKIRSIPVTIGGTTWKPSLPIESDIKEELINILTSKLSIVDKTIEFLLYVMKKQIFIDGNKRTAIIFANHYLIGKGKGIIGIPAELIDDYKILLINYYEGKDTKKIKEFLKSRCYKSIE